MWRRPASNAEPRLAAALREPRIRFWRTLATAAVREGWLRRGFDPAVIAALMIQIFSGVLGDWIAGDISIATLRGELKLGELPAAKHLPRRETAQ